MPPFQLAALLVKASGTYDEHSPLSSHCMAPADLKLQVERQTFIQHSAVQKRRPCPPYDWAPLPLPEQRRSPRALGVVADRLLQASTIGWHHLRATVAREWAERPSRRAAAPPLRQPGPTHKEYVSGTQIDESPAH